MLISPTSSQRPILLPIFGQSNALGASNNPPTQPGWALSHPGKSWWWQGGGTQYSGAGSADADGSTGNEFVTTAILNTDRERCHVGLAAQRRLIEEMGRDVALVHVAEGSTSLFSDWAAPPNNGAKDLANVFDGEVSAAVAHASFPLGSDFRVVGCFIQGEADAASEAQALAYESRLGALLDWLESRPWCVDPFWFVFRLNAANARTYTSEVRAAQEAVAAARSNVAIFDTDPYPLADADHYASTGYLGQGIQLAHEIMVRGL